MNAIMAGLNSECPWFDFLELLRSFLNCSDAIIIIRRTPASDPGYVISASGTEFGRDDPLPDAVSHELWSELPTKKICHLSEYRSYIASGRPAESLLSAGFGDVVALNITDPATDVLLELRCLMSAGASSLSDEQRTVLENLIPGMEVAVGVHARLANMDFKLRFYEDINERVSLGSILIDATGAVLNANSAARQILDASDGMRIRNGKIVCLDRKSSKDFRASLDKLFSADPAQTPHSVAFTIKRKESSRYWRVMCRLLPGHPAYQSLIGPLVHMLVRDIGEVDEVNASLLVELFGLTNAEARVAAKLANGCSIIEAAEELGVSPFTVRCQLSNIFDKTGCRRQAQLVGMILTTINRIWPLDDIVQDGAEADVRLPA